MAKTTQYCKAIGLQLKINTFLEKEKKSGWQSDNRDKQKPREQERVGMREIDAENWVEEWEELEWADNQGRKVQSMSSFLQ